jgi:hypothetical protein
MNQLKILLFGRFDRHEAHRRAHVAEKREASKVAVATW